MPWLPDGGEAEANNYHRTYVFDGWSGEWEEGCRGGEEVRGRGGFVSVRGPRVVFVQRVLVGRFREGGCERVSLEVVVRVPRKALEGKMS